MALRLRRQVLPAILPAGDVAAESAPAGPRPRPADLARTAAHAPPSVSTARKGLRSTPSASQSCACPSRPSRSSSHPPGRSCARLRPLGSERVLQAVVLPRASVGRMRDTRHPPCSCLRPQRRPAGGQCDRCGRLLSPDGARSARRDTSQVARLEAFPHAVRSRPPRARRPACEPCAPCRTHAIHLWAVPREPEVPEGRGRASRGCGAAGLLVSRHRRPPCALRASLSASPRSTLSSRTRRPCEDVDPDRQRLASRCVHGGSRQATIQSVESSSRIEGVTISPDRLRPVVLRSAAPRDRPEEETAGAREALDWIFSWQRVAPVTRLPGRSVRQ